MGTPIPTLPIEEKSLEDWQRGPLIAPPVPQEGPRRGLQKGLGCLAPHKKKSIKGCLPTDAPSMGEMLADITSGR